VGAEVVVGSALPKASWTVVLDLLVFAVGVHDVYVVFVFFFEPSGDLEGAESAVDTVEQVG